MPPGRRNNRLAACSNPETLVQFDNSENRQDRELLHGDRGNQQSIRKQSSLK
jgi:hypothetical protein